MAAIGSARMSGGGIEIEWVDAVLVGEKRRQFARLVGRPVPHDVVAALALAQLVVRPGDRIAETLLAGRQAERHLHKEFAMDRRRDVALSASSARHAT